MSEQHNKDKNEQSHQQAGHEVNGKHTAPGHAVHYTAPNGQKHPATIDRLDGVHADLTAHDGQKYTAVPHSATGGVHTWDHAE